MPEPVKVNVVSYGGVKPGQVVAGNNTDGTRTVVFDSSQTNCDYAFYNAKSLRSWNIPLPNITSGQFMFNNCYQLDSFEVDISTLTNGHSMFANCGALRVFDNDLRSMTTQTNMFISCTNLESFSADLRSMTNGINMFYNCTNLESFSADLRSMTNGQNMFINCKKLKSFYAGPLGLQSLTEGIAFDACKLDLQSVQHIADTIRPSKSGAAMTIGVDSTAITQAQQDALDAQFREKNWTIQFIRR